MHTICTSFLFTLCTFTFNAALQKQPNSTQLTDQITLMEPTHRVLPLKVKHTDFSTENIASIMSLVRDGSGSNSDKQYPKHVFQEFGTWTDSLKVTTKTGLVFMVVNEQYITGVKCMREYET